MKKNWWIYPVVVACAVAVGASVGVVIKRFVVDPEQEIIGFNPNACKPDAEALFKKFNKSSDPKSDLRPYELVLYAQEQYKRAENSTSYCYGMANAVAVGLNVEQYVRSAQVRSGNNYYEEQVSKSSQVACSKRMYINDGSDKTILYKEKEKGKYIQIDDNITTSQYELQKECTPSEYKELYGRELPDMFIYIIHQITVETENLKEVDNGYEIELVLKPAQGGYNYRYQMVSVSDLEGMPSFKSIKLTYLLSKDFVLKELTADEQFVAAKMGFNADTHNVLNYKYFQGKTYKIPKIDEDFDYKTLKEGN